MDEERVLAIISYIQQYPDVSTDKLVGNLLQSYSMNEVKEALRRLGISPIVIPGYVEPIPPPTRPFYTRVPVVIISIIVVLMFVGGTAAMYIIRQNVKSKKTTPSTRTATPTSIVTSAPTAGMNNDPTNIIKKALASADYKITLETEVLAFKKELFITMSEKDSGYNKNIVYTKKGQIVRYETQYPYAALDGIFKDNNSYFFSPQKKQYVVVPTKQDGGTYESIKFVVKPFALIDFTEKKFITWSKMSQTEWKGIWKSANPNNPDYHVTVRIMIDPTTRLLTKYSEEASNGEYTNYSQYTYETLSNIDSFLTIPEGYTQIQLSPTAGPEVYTSDVQALYEAASKLGYEKANELNFFRFQGTFESTDDISTLVFSTNDTLETFSPKIESSGLIQDKSIPNIYGIKLNGATFADDVNASYAYDLVIADSTTEYREMPVSATVAPEVTEWPVLLQTQGKQLKLTIFFAQFKKSGVFWKDTVHGKTIPGPVVVIKLNR